jgi:hypothetical protein
MLVEQKTLYLNFKELNRIRPCGFRAFARAGLSRSGVIS